MVILFRVRTCHMPKEAESSQGGLHTGEYLGFVAMFVVVFLCRHAAELPCLVESVLSARRRSLAVTRDLRDGDFCDVVLTSLLGCDDSSVDCDWSEQVDAVSS